MMEYWPNIPYLIKLPKLGAYLGRYVVYLAIEISFKPNLVGDTCQQLIGWKIMKLKIMEIKICLIIYIIIISIIIFFILKNNYTMIKLWSMITHMSFMTRILIINSIIYLKISSS